MKLTALLQQLTSLNLQDQPPSHPGHTFPGSWPPSDAGRTETDTMSLTTAETAPASAQSQRPSATIVPQPGIFLDIGDFMRSENTSLSNGLEYERANDARLESGCIIYINDDVDSSSRIDKRVMLMFKDCWSSSYGCVSFCRHKRCPSSPGEVKVHRLVCQVGSHWAEPSPSDMQAISVELYDASLAEGITINLQEIWNVKSEVKVSVIGRVPPQDWPSVRRQIDELFHADSSTQWIVAPTSVPTPTKPGRSRR